MIGLTILDIILKNYCNISNTDDIRWCFFVHHDNIWQSILAWVVNKHGSHLSTVTYHHTWQISTPKGFKFKWNKIHIFTHLTFIHCFDLHFRDQKFRMYDVVFECLFSIPFCQFDINIFHQSKRDGQTRRDHPTNSSNDPSPKVGC